MRLLGYRPGRVFHRCDFWYVPVHRRYFTSEVEDMLRDSGFKSWQRLLRGADHDWDEIYYNNSTMDHAIFGEGEMRYMVEK